MSLREQWIRPLDALPLDYQHVIAITSSGQEEEMYLVDDKWHIVDGVRIPIEFVVFWHEKREQPIVEMAEDCVSREQAINELKLAYFNKDLQSAKDDPCIVDAMTDWAIRTIKNLPSVQSQPKRGHWIIVDDCEHFIAKCDICGNVIDSRLLAWHSEKYAYCSLCGADMREVQDER